MIGAFWSWLVLGLLLHAWKFISSKRIRDAEESAKAERNGVKTLEDMETEEYAKFVASLDNVETGKIYNNDKIKDEVSTDGDNSN